jgi:hypothetical protein
MKQRWMVRRATDSDASALEGCMHAAYQVYTDWIRAEDLPSMNVDYAVGAAILRYVSQPIWRLLRLGADGLDRRLRRFSQIA